MAGAALAAGLLIGATVGAWLLPGGGPPPVTVRGLRDLKRLLPRLEKQPAPVHDGAGATGVHH